MWVNLFRSVSFKLNKRCLLCKIQFVIYFVVILKTLLVLGSRDDSEVRSTYSGMW